MKKSLIAIAALAATGAFAQSSVTLYGVADLSLAKASGVSTQLSGNGTLNNGGSRFGLRGTEDLGGGLKANFNFEAGVNAETGATDASTFQRAAWAELAGNFGSVRLGRTLTPSFYGVTAWELTGAANYSVVASQFSVAGSGSRNNSQISYSTPNMSGFSGTLGFITKPDNGGNSKVDANLIYANGPLAVALSYNKVQTLEKNWALGANYNFGAFKIAGSFQDPAGLGKGFTLGGSTNLGAFALTLDIARDTHFKDTNTLLEAKYALSKRTFVYGAYLRDGKGKTVSSSNIYGVGVRHNF
jgi:predicted porin